MTPDKKVTTPLVPSKYSRSATERRAAHFAAMATRQSELKLEAAERRARRAQSER